MKIFILMYIISFFLISTLNISLSKSMVNERFDYLFLSPISPNPVNHNFNLKIYHNPIKNFDDTSVKIFNFSGNEIKNYKIEREKIDDWTSNLIVNISTYTENGVYFIKVELGNNVKCKKFLIQN